MMLSTSWGYTTWRILSKNLALKTYEIQITQKLRRSFMNFISKQTFFQKNYKIYRDGNIENLQGNHSKGTTKEL